MPFTDKQKDQMKLERLSGLYTLSDLAIKYGVGRERMRQLTLPITGNYKKIEKQCIVCGRYFIHYTTGDRQRCSTICTPNRLPRKCVDCPTYVKFKSRKQLRCKPCQKNYRKKAQVAYWERVKTLRPKEYARRLEGMRNYYKKT